MSALAWILVALGAAAALGIGALHIGDLIGISAAVDAAEDSHDDHSDPGDPDSLDDLSGLS